VLEFLEGRFQFLAIGGSGEDAVKPYPLVEDLLRPVLRIGMPRASRQGPAGRRQLAEGRRSSEPRAERWGRRRIETMPSQDHEVRP
jgi:hypothetical protein